MTRTERLMYNGTGPAAARGSASRRRRGQYVRTEWGQFESSGVSKSVAVLSDSVGAHTRAAAPEVVPFSDQSGATALSPDAGQSGSFRSSRVIAVNTGPRRDGGSAGRFAPAGVGTREMESDPTLTPFLTWPTTRAVSPRPSGRTRCRNTTTTRDDRRRPSRTSARLPQSRRSRGS